MVNPHHVSSGLVARQCELGADTVFLVREHSSASFEDVRAMAACARGAGGRRHRPPARPRPLDHKLAGTLVFEHEMKRWVKVGVQFFYIHSDPFLRSGLARMRDLPASS